MSEKIYVPPIKIQGIKTKLVSVIKKNVILNKNTIWVEPFMGSGVVGFNINPDRAIFADVNPHIINFYNELQNGTITPYIIRSFLEKEGQLLSKNDDKHYYMVRERFNSEHNSLDFLFLNRACFNGMIRFNKNYDFNVPYGHKPMRFSKAYITKIVNQADYIVKIMKNKDWKFICQTFEKTISDVSSNSFIYCDPPYIGRNVDYYDSWNEENEILLNKYLFSSNMNFMISTWDYNQYRKNEYITKIWSRCNKININHYYHIGAKESNRAPMTEALLSNYDFEDSYNYFDNSYNQLSFE